MVAIGVLVFFLVRGNGGTSKSSAGPVTTFNSLPGVRKTKAPWPPEYAYLSDRLPALNLTANPTEQLAYHIHEHLDIFVNGKPVPRGVPAGIGINDDAYITELHTHDASGVIHVEAPSNKHYRLGTFFAEWGVFLNRKCVGAYCGGYKWYVNGKPQTGNPQKLLLENHQEVAIVIGKPPKKIPSTFAWAAHGV